MWEVIEGATIILFGVILIWAIIKDFTGED